MNNDVHHDAACCLFQFEGELRADHVEGLFDLILASPVDEPRQVLVDCRLVSRFDDDALEALADFQACIGEMGGKVMVVGLAHPRLRHVVFLDAAVAPPASAPPSPAV